MNPSNKITAVIGLSNVSPLMLTLIKLFNPESGAVRRGNMKYIYIYLYGVMEDRKFLTMVLMVQCQLGHSVFIYWFPLRNVSFSRMGASS